MSGANTLSILFKSFFSSLNPNAVCQKSVLLNVSRELLFVSI